jgi:flagellar basal-body rod protein FlgC
MSMGIVRSKQIMSALTRGLNTSVAAIEMNKEFLRLTSENIAHANTKASDPGGEAYKAKLPVIGSKIDVNTGALTVFLKRIESDQTPQVKEYDPSHPGADPETGMVARSNVSDVVEKVHLAEYLKAAQANMNAYQVTKKMIQREIDLLKTS